MMPNKGLSEAFLDPKKPKNRSETGAQEVRSLRFFRNSIATLYQEAFREIRGLFLEVYDTSGNGKNSDFPKENQWFSRFRRFRYRIVFVSYFPRLGPLRRPQKSFKWSPKSSSEEYQMKLRLERAFKIVSKTDFGSKMIPQSSPKSLPKSFPKVIALGSPSEGIF